MAMKKYTAFLAAVILALVCGDSLTAQISENLNGSATPVEIGREFPRTRTISYPSQQAAMDGSGEPSRYFQPLAEWTKGTDSDGNVVYSTKFKVPFEWIERRHFLHIGSVTSSYVVIVNGDLVGYNQSGCTAAEFDVTEVSTEGLNRVEVIIYKNPAAAVLQSANAAPEITGETYVVSQPRIRIRDYTARANLAGDNNTLELGVIVKSHLLNPKTVRVYYSLFDPDGAAGPYGHRDADFEMKLEDTVRFFVNIPDARPWSHESPNVYTLLLRLQHEGRYTEYVAYRFGLRTAGMQDGVFTVNGRPVQLHMAEYAYKGDPSAAERELRDLRNSGINTVKVKGFPQPDIFYDICDRVGLYVCNQADIDTRASGTARTKGGNPSNDPQWEEAYTDRAATMYHTSKNHPSVVMFSLAENSANGYNLYESYLALKSLEYDRPVVYLDGGGEWNTDALLAALHRKYPHGIDQRIKLEDSPESATGETLPSFAAMSPGDVLPADRDRLAAAEGASGFFSIRNNYRAANLRSPLVEWKVRQGKRVVSEGSRAIEEDIEAGGSATFAVPYGKAKPGTPLAVELTVYRPREAFDPAPAPSGKKKNSDRANLIKLTEQTLTVTF